MASNNFKALLSTVWVALVSFSQVKHLVNGSHGSVGINLYKIPSRLTSGVTRDSISVTVSFEISGM